MQVSRNQNPTQLFRAGNSETTIAGVDDGEKLVAGWNDAEGFDFAPFNRNRPPRGLSGFGVSVNGGRTWTDAGAPPIDTIIGFGPGPRGRSATGRYVTRGDPWLAVGTSEDDDPDDATVFYSNLAVWEDDANLPPAGVSVHRGRFSDRSFAFMNAVLLQSPNYPRDFVDKNAIATRGQNVAVTLTNFIETCNQPLNGFGQIELTDLLTGARPGRARSSSGTKASSPIPPSQVAETMESSARDRLRNSAPMANCSSPGSAAGLPRS